MEHISIHALREEGDIGVARVGIELGEISIHALREEGDASCTAANAAARYFYPRPPRGGRPGLRHGTTAPPEDFYPRPPRGGRPIDDLLQVPEVQISIHALREEGDLRLDQILDLAAEFLSTPSARRATDAVEAKVKAQQISIHALREEGDAAVNDLLQRHNISIHALREEGD